MNKNKEKAPTKKAEIINKPLNQKELTKTAPKSIISPKRLKDGGPLIFATHKTNHQILIHGKIVINPLIKTILRLPTDS